MSVASRPLPQIVRPSVPALRARRGWPDVAMHVLVLAPVLLLALALRLINLGAYSGLFDEGIRTEQLFLMAHGYRPFKDIFAAQGPLLLDALYPPYAFFRSVVDSPLVAVRLAAVSYSLLGLAGLYWLGCQLAGRLGGLIAALLLALSPLYLEGSRLALAEVPALAPAILSLGCAVRYSTHGKTRWIAAAGLLLTVSMLMKPITFAAAPAVALAALLCGRQGLRDLLLVGTAMLAFSVVVVWLLGFNEVRDQILAYRQASRETVGWSLRKNLQAIVAGLGFEPAALLPLAGLDRAPGRGLVQVPARARLAARQPGPVASL
jgi:predicted membrane-bound mannosyltransferase